MQEKRQKKSGRKKGRKVAEKRLISCIVKKSFVHEIIQSYFPIDHPFSSPLSLSMIYVTQFCISILWTLSTVHIHISIPFLNNYIFYLSMSPQCAKIKSCPHLRYLTLCMLYCLSDGNFRLVCLGPWQSPIKAKGKWWQDPYCLRLLATNK